MRGVICVTSCLSWLSPQPSVRRIGGYARAEEMIKSHFHDMRTESPIFNVFIVDDHPMVVLGIQEQLKPLPYIAVCGDAYTAGDARTRIGELHPDLAIIDISLGEESGIDLIRELRAEHPKIRIIVYTMHNTRQCFKATLALGVSGYILKTDHPGELIAAVESAVNGRTYFAKEVLNNLNENSSKNKKNGRSQKLDALSAQELQVLKMVASGYRNHEIAHGMNWGIRTVERHRESLMEKLDIHSVAELTILAIKEKLVDLSRQ